MQCVLVGNYGVKNLGDEALKDYFLHAFPDIDWIVLSAEPAANELPRLPLGIRSFFQTRWWRTVAAIRSADAVIFGGGSLFTDVESVFACVLWWLHAAVARFFGTPVYLAFQGMGPYKTTTGERLARWTARHAAFLSVRDEESGRRAQSWNLSIKIVQTFDPVFSSMVSKKIDMHPKNVLTIIPRHNTTESFQKNIKTALALHPTTEGIHILLMQPDLPAEKGIASSLQQGLLPRPSTVIPVWTIELLMQELACSSFVVTQRFHGALAALAAGIPQEVVPQREGDKLSELQRVLQKPDAVPSLQALIAEGESALSHALGLY